MAQESVQGLCYHDRPSATHCNWISQICRRRPSSFRVFRSSWSNWRSRRRSWTQVKSTLCSIHLFLIRKWVEQDLPRRIGKPVEFHQCHRKVNFQHDIDDVMCQTWIWYWVYFRVIHEVINCKNVHITTRPGSLLILLRVNYLLDVTKSYCNSCTHIDRRKQKSQTCSSFQLLAFWFVQYRLSK